MKVNTNIIVIFFSNKKNHFRKKSLIKKFFEFSFKNVRIAGADHVGGEVGRKRISDRVVSVDVDCLGPEEDHRTEDERFAGKTKTAQSQTQRLIF